jgi:hypothetical protein
MVIVLDRCARAVDAIVLPILRDANAGFNSANNAVIITGMVLAAMWARDAAVDAETASGEKNKTEKRAITSTSAARRRELLVALSPWMLTANHVPRTVAQVVFANALQSCSPAQLAAELDFLGPMASAIVAFISTNTLIQKAHRSASKSSVLSLVLPRSAPGAAGGDASVAEWWSLSRCLRLAEGEAESGAAMPASHVDAAQQRSIDLNEAVRSSLKHSQFTHDVRQWWCAGRSARARVARAFLHARHRRLSRLPSLPPSIPLSLFLSLFPSLPPSLPPSLAPSTHPLPPPAPPFLLPRPPGQRSEGPRLGERARKRGARRADAAES